MTIYTDERGNHYTPTGEPRPPKVGEFFLNEKRKINGRPTVEVAMYDFHLNWIIMRPINREEAVPS